MLPGFAALGQQTLECFLQGVIPPESKGPLEIRLGGLSDVFIQNLRFHELVYRSLKVAGTTGGPVDTEVRARLDLTTRSWTIRYQGVPVVREKLNIVVRPVVEVQVSDNISAFLEALGYQMEYELLREGVVWRSPRNIYTSITQIKKIPTRSDLSSAVLLDPSGSWLVEATLLTTDDKIGENAEELQSFVDQLAPIVDMLRVNARLAVEAPVPSPALPKLPGGMGARAPPMKPS